MPVKKVIHQTKDGKHHAKHGKRVIRKVVSDTSSEVLWKEDHAIIHHKPVVKEHAVKHHRGTVRRRSKNVVKRESTSTETEVIETILPRKKKVKTVVHEQSQSTSTEVVEKVLPKRVKVRKIVQE